jgi:hypothetical protein
MSLSCKPLDIHCRVSDTNLTYTWPHTDMSFVSQIPTEREIYAFEKLSFEYPWKIKMSLSRKPLNIHWRLSDMKLTYKCPHTIMSLYLTDSYRSRDICLWKIYFRKTLKNLNVSILPNLGHTVTWLRHDVDIYVTSYCHEVCLSDSYRSRDICLWKINFRIPLKN